VLQAPIFECLSFDPFSSFDDLGCPAEVGVGRCHIVEALVVALVIVVLDERLDLLFEIAGQAVVFQQDAVLQCLVPALDLALCLRMEGRTAHMVHLFAVEIIRQFPGDVVGAIVAEQTRPMQDIGMITA